MTLFRYFTSDGGKNQHPDAMFSPGEKLVLVPGASYEPKGTMWFLSVGGTAGGRAAWQADIDRLESRKW